MTPQEIDIALTKAQNATGLSAFEDSAIAAMVYRRKRGSIALMNWQMNLLQQVAERADRASNVGGTRARGL